MHDAMDAGLRDLDAILVRLEAKVAVLPSRAFIAGVLARAVVRTVGVAALAGAAVTAVASLVMR